MQGLFDLPSVKSTASKDAAAVSKASARATHEPNAYSFESARQKLKNHMDEYDTIRTSKELHNFMEDAVAHKYVAIDTETTGLDPLTCEIVGFSLYVPTRKAAYVPLNHVSAITFMKVPNQLSKEDAAKELRWGEENGIKWIYHNYAFDKRVIKHALGVELSAYWDTQKAWRYLNENESSALKVLTQKYLDTKDDEALTFESLFSGTTFDKVPIGIATLYAAGDPKKTYDLYEFEIKTFDRNDELRKIKDLFLKIELPVQDVLTSMMDTGVQFDNTECQKMRGEWEKELALVKEDVSKIVEEDKDKILAYMRLHPKSPMRYPLNTSSVTQVATYLYDILGCELSKGDGRSTGVDDLKRINNVFCKELLKQRELEKIITTYLDALPQCVNKDGRIHPSYNSYGAATGRMTCNSPNLQQIPSRHNEIRNMFVAKEGCVLISADYSQQEPRLLAYCSKDPNMIHAYKEGKDIYSWMASLVYKKKYEECLEHNADGSVNEKGKKLRKNMKSVVLGIMYGMSQVGLAENLSISEKEASKILKDFAKAFPAVNKFVLDTVSQAQKTGYVKTVWGRKRRLPELKLKQYELKPGPAYTQVTDILDFDSITELTSNKLSDADYALYMNKLTQCRTYMERKKAIEEAERKGIQVIDNGGKISSAKRQAVNSIIQGSASDMTKWAMILIHNNERLKSMDANLVLQVHDEVILECPEESAEEAGRIVKDCMIKAAEDMIDIPMKCDVAIAKRWGDL